MGEKNKKIEEKEVVKKEKGEIKEVKKKKWFGEKKEDTFSYNGWMKSDNWMKRSLGVFVHNFLGLLIIYGILLLIVLVMSLITMLFRAIL